MSDEIHVFFAEFADEIREATSPISNAGNNEGRESELAARHLPGGEHSLSGFALDGAGLELGIQDPALHVGRGSNGWAR